ERVRHTIAAIKIARRLGAACITTEPGGPLDAGVSRDAALDTFLAGLNQALRCAEDEGVALLVEPEPGLLIESADEFLELAARVDSPMFGLNFDVGHFYCVADPLPETIARLQAYTRHYHVEDIAASRVHEHLIPGRGAIDFATVMAAIHNTGYDGWVTVELYPYLDDPDAAGAEARARLLPLLNT
ncbi:MAG: sugar phosphate isomerase/epimerase family protein, partial [Phycisphaerae bacterium]